jgi:hypothetical protein
MAICQRAKLYRNKSINQFFTAKNGSAIGLDWPQLVAEPMPA